MKKKKNIVSVEEHIRIFRYFSGGVALVFFLLHIVPGPLGEIDPVSRKTMTLFSITYGAIFIYLVIPGLENLLNRFYLPPVLFAGSIIPIAIINAKYKALLETGSPINTLDDTMTVTILLLFPLITTAWQYSFPIVFLFFVVLGFIDPLIIILANESFTPAIYGAFNASLIRILALGAVGFMITMLRDQQRTERQELEDANRKLEEYALASEKLAASRERNRIARELHDTLAHTLSGLAIQLEAVKTVTDGENPQLTDMMDKARTTIREGLNETRRALRSLRASPLDDLGLSLALQRLVEDIAGRNTIDIRTQITEENPDWSENLEEGIYRIAQESLENIIRHADASKAELKLEGSSHYLILKVSDNGRGFEAGSFHEEGRYGLRGMKERATALGGDLSINSRIGRGSEIIFTWEAPDAGTD
jgi:signal transduction histidine kinase